PLAHQPMSGRDTTPAAGKRGHIMAEGATGDTGAPRANRGAVSATCAMHRGPRGFANLVLEKRLEPDGAEIILDPNVTGACVLILDEDAAVVVRDALIEWLG
ncbi:MAG: hypothetical protein ACRDRS_13915, partial [Pseudonocardiaceae bacterium]